MPITTLDVLPTILNVVGMEPPEDRELYGTSILPHLLHNEEIQREKPLYWQTEVQNNWETFGTGYNRIFDGTRRVDIPTPRVAIRRGDYVLRGFNSNEDEDFARPDIFQLYNVVEDRDEMVEMSGFKPEIYER